MKQRKSTLDQVIVDALKSQAFINAGAINVYNNEILPDGEGNLKDQIYSDKINVPEKIED
ncbi:hypothetical protein [Clostridium hydrogeniformans]|uniref:hypothetical protein n=1 Tax=Clostridium hydrogeniformans TaxID=349933 RepID=UPI000483DAE9|nr:hypothetical protein [Clostridium hydrogeniformans]